ncbi:dUTP diphosphatase [Oceanobacillus sojae]|uniref:dUTP diphosphatase n=1 Tax=Oceanobacillus sojae TaxID=582851 RepID=UPI00362655B7
MNQKSEQQVQFKRRHDSAILPTKAHPSDSGFDLYASEDVIIEPGETKVVPTGVAVGLPKGTEAQVRPRSGITSKTKLRVQLGTIDNGYTGEIGVIVDNIAIRSGLYGSTFDMVDGSVTGIYDENMRQLKAETYTYVIRKGDKIAQLVVQQLPQLEVVEVPELDDSQRGGNGFGSSGVNKESEKECIDYIQQSYE